MKAVIQRVREAEVKVQGETVGSAGYGLLLLVGFHNDDTFEEVKWTCNKILKLRIFNDEEGIMNKSATDVTGDILVVSQFTLYGDAQKGNRPSYIDAADPDKAEKLYNEMINYFKNQSDLAIQTGVFGAHMDVSLVNDGPVTIILEK